MLEQLKYRNHLGETFEFGKNGIFVDMNELHDYEWSVKTRNNKISALDREIGKRSLPCIIICSTEGKGIAARNKLLEICEKDVLALQHGRVIIGDYYFRCFITRSKKSKYLTNKRYMKVDLTLTSDFPFWVREETFNFRKTDTGVTGGKNLDYSFDFPFDYYSELAIHEFFNTGFVDTNFRLTIHGACVNPKVFIDGHGYGVNCVVGAGEYVTVDSIKKTVTLTTADGTVLNEFNQRDRSSYIFEKIKPGSNHVAWDGDFQVDVTLLEERSEPKWT